MASTPLGDFPKTTNFASPTLEKISGYATDRKSAPSTILRRPTRCRCNHRRHGGVSASRTVSGGDAVQSRCSTRGRRLKSFQKSTRCAAGAASAPLETAILPLSRPRRRRGSAAVVEYPDATRTTCSDPGRPGLRLLPVGRRTGRRQPPDSTWWRSSSKEVGSLWYQSKSSFSGSKNFRLDTKSPRLRSPRGRWKH